MKTATFPMIPNFEVVSKLGAGGMGSVFLCRSVGAYGFKKLLAVKVINARARGRESARAMFLDEARLVAQLDHPTITQVFDFGESGDALYLVMEYVPGISLAEALIEQMQFPPLICASIVAAVCRGLHAAHEATGADGRPLNVVHRDVTPSNLVLTFSGQVKILDFGIALMRDRSAPVTSVGQIRGKPTYLAPEQFEHGTIDRRTDLYSLSIVLYEILTLTKLFTLDAYLGAAGPEVPDNWAEVAASVEPPSKIVGQLPEGLDEIVMKGLAVDPALRFQTAKEMALALEKVIEREGCETLDAFADRALADRRQQHDRDLRAQTDPSASAVPLQHPETLDAKPPVLEPETEPGSQAVAEPQRVPPQAPATEPQTVLSPAAPASRTGRTLAGLVIALIAIVGVASLLARETTEPPAKIQTVARPEPAPRPTPKKAAIETAPIEVTASKQDRDPPATIEEAPPPSRAIDTRARRKVHRRRAKPAKRKKKPSREISSDGIMQEW